ncbi:MAG TPA: hypothetical protein VNW95_09345 [Mucilaginibacter sp.]|jgi:hypothetical protein|nr:hypothetical protein [Mucilaginibacter sp.]
MKLINLNILEDGSTGLSPRNGAFLGEAASVCLKHNGHPVNISMPSEGHFQETYDLTCYEVGEDAVGSFADMQETTEYGACGIALAIIATELSLQAERSWKGTGFDYWLGKRDEGLPFENSARLEVSGIISGTEEQAAQRLRQKLDQTKVSDADPYLSAYAIIVEFSNPRTLTGIR